MKNKKPLIGIIGGRGKMGSWFRSFFERQGLKVIISDKKTKTSNIELAKKADVVIVSVPISKTKEAIKEVRNFVRKNALLTDFTSLKVEPLKEMKKAKSGVLGMHPLFGPLALDLRGETIVFSRQKDNRWVFFLKNLFQKNGAKIVKIYPEEHDKQMAFLQALLHFTNISFTRFLYSKKFKPLAHFLTPVFKLQSLIFGRILAQNPELYASIELENPYFRKILNDYLKDISEFGKIVQGKNYQAFKKNFALTASYLSDFIEVAKEKSTGILKMLEKQPIKIGPIKKINIKKARAGFLGPEETFSWTAAKKIFSKSISLRAFTSIKGIFEAISREEVDLGVAPIENTIGGLVSETMQSFINYQVCALGSFKMPVHHFFASRGKDLKKIKIVKSHSQALSQCRKWLELNLPGVIKEPAQSTISPVLEDSSETIGFILPPFSAERLGLRVLAENIEDSKENFTRFFIITSSLEKSLFQKLNLKTKNTLLLISAYDRAGVLRDILNIFADKNINLVALHSIPAYSSPWDYLFFLEVEKSYFSKDLKKCLKELEEHCPFIRVLGVS